LEELCEFPQKVSEQRIVNSRAQIAFKLTCPGVKDIYQGCELWNLSMVDPDNRRPVDYQIRQNSLDTQDINIKDIWKNRFNGRVKIWLLQQLLQFRACEETVLEKGDYVPLKVSGKCADEVIAFAKVYEEKWIVMVLRIRARTDLQATYLHLPKDVPVAYKNILTKETGVTGNKIAISKLLKILPVAVLRLGKSTKERNAGILLHITSLPSVYGIGDFGPQARQFADTLKKSYQRYWQILPLNSVSAADGFSPYSSTSSQAGIILLISPQVMIEDGLLALIDLGKYRHQRNKHADFEVAAEIKQRIFEQAWQFYKAHSPELLKQSLELFCMQESYWLNDYALYCLEKIPVKKMKKWTALFDRI